ncbi:unnamed protein product [Adineta steineri]|uniref:SH3 domain-containing protein n=1 Tax=Adineta steineri TaxID=433720 RepID=A0A814BXI9_9BILA|nr:unnamed protein product [Adineta steineri]
MQLAIALYNNDVDDEDELEFLKGDILTVLIENPNGLNGWWLCQHNGKCGLCPGNRLKLISDTTTSSEIKLDKPKCSSPCLSTASMYDSLSNDYDIPITASTSSSLTTSSSEHDYDIPQGSDVISNSHTPIPNDSSPESSSRSSGIYSTNDLRLSDLSSSSSSSEFHTSTMNGSSHTHALSSSSSDIDQLQTSFRKLSIRSLLLDKYRQLLSNSNTDSINHLFISECRIFLYDYGCLLDRHTYKIFKQNLLYELEHITKNNNQRIIQLATQIIYLIKPIIELRLKQKNTSFSSIPVDVFKKLNLEPIEELTNENENKKMPTSMSTTQIYGNFQNKKSKGHTRSLQMTTSKTCHSNFLTEINNKSDDYDYIDDDYSTIPSTTTDPLVKCYHRHIREHISSMFMRYSHLSQLNRQMNETNTTALLITEGKALIVAGHKLVFVLETLHEHLRHSIKIKQIQTPLIYLTKQLCDALTSFVQLLKQFSNQNCTNIQKFQHDTQIIMNLVKKIKQQCSSV